MCCKGQFGLKLKAKTGNTQTPQHALIYTALPYRLSVMYDLVTKGIHVCCIINLLQNNYSIAGQLVGCVFDVSSV